MENIITKQTEPMNGAAVDGILRSLDVSEQTLRDYRCRIDLFIRHTKENGFGPATFIEFKRGLAGRSDLSVSSKNKYLSAAKSFLQELNRWGYVPVDITQKVKSFRQSRGHKVMGLEASDVEAVSEKITELAPTPKNNRLKAFFALLVLQGLRQIEIVRLDVGDLDLKRGTAFIHGKGRDEKEIIYLAPGTVKALNAYLASNGVTYGALFRSMGNRHSDRLSTMTVNREVKKLFKMAGVEKSVHGIRHFYITNLLKKFDVRDAIKFSRHKSFDMLLIYDDELDLKEKSRRVFECLPAIGI